MSYLIDTDWIIDYLNGTRRAVVMIESLIENGVGISLVTYGDVYDGIYFGTKQEAAEASFLRLLRVIPIFDSTKRSCGATLAFVANSGAASKSSVTRAF